MYSQGFTIVLFEVLFRKRKETSYYVSVVEGDRSLKRRDSSAGVSKESYKNHYVGCFSIFQIRKGKIGYFNSTSHFHEQEENIKKSVEKHLTCAFTFTFKVRISYLAQGPHVNGIECQSQLMLAKK